MSTLLTMKLGLFWGACLIQYRKTKTTSWKKAIGAQFINFPKIQTNQQGFQMKILIKKQTVLKIGQKKAKLIVQKPKFVVLLFICHKETSKLQEYHYKFSSKSRLSLAWPHTEPYYWCFSDFSWFVKLHTLSAMAPQFAHWSIGSFLHPCESDPPLTPEFTTKIIRTLHLMSLPHFYRGDADLSASVEPAWCLRHIT